MKQPLINLLGTVLAVIIMLAGLLVPRGMLAARERAELGSVWALSVISGKQEKHAEPAPMQTAEPTAGPGSVQGGRTEELKAALSMLSQSEERLPREPREGELSMGNAVELARMNIHMLLNMEGFPRADIYSFTLEYAELLEPVFSHEPETAESGENTAVWCITFVEYGMGSVIFAEADAKDGTLYSLYVSLTAEEPPEAPFEMLLSYADYLGIAEDGPFRARREGKAYSAEFSGILLTVEISCSGTGSFFEMRAGC